ncbi:uncharacterized protein LY89DRAFT_713292 [Mollisia scopiformis]|uniref:Protein kinase domain-containing protein n=1 Tax=Mollisia scopiformis TaxID=149040 RepID=A0A194XW29_MOLSC|nr:uncharacterized protein LY89DRAFT_713292 [Mollisia scopiformis]KUJ24438.1 hypothetical protein LY89DRAFT_713292 [Mollisia scopiformis]
MVSTSQYSTWPVITSSSNSSATKPAPSPALDFLTAVATTDVEEYDLHEIGMISMDDVRSMDERMVGKGGFAVVELGKTRENHLVAVKRLRVSARDIQADFESHLRRICLELRILSHEPLRTHPNIVDILGYCLSDIAGYEIPFLALVLEYSSEGNLKTFLKDARHDLPLTTLLALTAQVADGLGVLHQCKICHGDVKTQNALVFKSEDAWTVKLSDFGESTIGQFDDQSLSIECGFGTPLLNAPELRSGMVLARDLFTIEDAIRTDIFSFGLLTWEVLKRGESYFDKSWCIDLNGSNEIDQMEAYLQRLPHNGLLSKVCDYIQNSLVDTERVESVLCIFKKSLQDDPQKRFSMEEIRRHFEIQNHSMGNNEQQESNGIEDERLCAWSTRDTFLELRDSAFLNGGLGFLTFPLDLQKRVFNDLISMSVSETFTMPSRAHAALCVAECHTVGFGVQHDMKQAVQWVHTASELGSIKAAAWYPRLCTIDNVTLARSSSMMGFEENLSHLTSDTYLSTRVHLQIRIAIQQIRTTFLNWDQQYTWDSSAYMSSIRVFNEWEQDDLSSLHVAALLGEDEAISKLLCYAKGDELSSRGLTAAHYACIGGRLSTLQLLLNDSAQSAISKAANPGGITLLHLCIFFSGEDVGKAVSLILAIGVDPRGKVIQPVEWEYHDIRLAGTPLDWAVRIRDKSLVVSLLPFAQDDTCLKLAIRSFFWEIAEVILQYACGAKNIPIKYSQQLSELSIEDMYLLTIERPFGHWLAHGPDHLIALERTVQVCLDHCLMASGSASHRTLSDIVSLASFEDDFSLLASFVAKLSPEDVKRKNKRGESALEQALTTSEDTEAWRTPLETIINVYTIKELEERGSISVDDFSYLHLAISSDSLIGTRILLQKGVDVNQRSDGLLGDTPLTLSASSRFSKEFHSLLLEHGAKDDVVDDITGTNLLVHGLMRSQPNEDLLRGVLRNEDLSEINDTLHVTLGYFISGYSLRGAVAEVFKRDDAMEYSGTSRITLDKDELKILWDNLQGISQLKKWELKRIFGKEQLSLMLRLADLDSTQRPASLDLVVNVGEMNNVLGAEETQHILGQWNAEPAVKSGRSQLAETEDEDGHEDGDASDPDNYNNADQPDQYWKELFKIQLGLPNWVTYINERNSSGMTLLHSAAYNLHPESIALLLEAGADASIPYVSEGHNAVLPLQIACSSGRTCEWARVQGTSTEISSLSKHSMDVAAQLLDWHHTRSDGLFQDVNQLHLASRMMLRDVARRLRRDGQCVDVEVHWPGIDNPVTCDVLALQLADDDRLIDISKLITAGYPMNKAQV